MTKNLDFHLLPRPDLEKLLSDLYDRFENVRNFIDLRLSGNREQLIKKYKKLIRNRLIEDIEEGTNRLREALNAVHEFSAAGTSPRDQAECFRLSNRRCIASQTTAISMKNSIRKLKICLMKPSVL